MRKAIDMQLRAVGANNIGVQQLQKLLGTQMPIQSSTQNRAHNGIAVTSNMTIGTMVTLHKLYVQRLGIRPQRRRQLPIQ